MNKREYELKRIDTVKPSNLFSDRNNKLFFCSEKTGNNKHFSNQLLLALSDEEIKEGDWYYYFEHIYKYEADEHALTPNCKKIIASNSQELTPNALLPDSYIETFAKGFNNGNAPETIWLEIFIFRLTLFS